MTKTVLVTGGAGYIGSHTLKALTQAGFHPVTLDNLSTGNRHAVKWGSFVKANLSDYEAVCGVMRKHRVSAVIHFAASAYVGESVVHPRNYFDNNVANSLTLLRAMLDCNVGHIVFSSTCATYGIPATLPITEATPQVPVNPYGDTKLMVEKILKWYGEAYGLRSVCLRYFNASGADHEGEIGEEHDPETHLAPSIIETALGIRERFELNGTDYSTPDGTAVRDYVHVSDLASAHVLALRYLFAGNQSNAFNLGTGRGCSIYDVIRAVERVSGTRVRTTVRPRRAGDPPQLVASAAKARAELGWRPEWSDLDQIVGTAWNWHSRQESRVRAVAV
jgi:UDP-glucose 4-epimerase